MNCPYPFSLNPLAPPWYFDSACFDVTPPGFRDDYGEYVIEVALTAGATSDENIIQTDGDSCFCWRLTGATILVGSGSGNLLIRFRDHLGEYMSPSRLLLNSFLAGGQFTIPQLPALVVPPGGQIQVDLQEADGASGATINIALRGVKRFSLAGWGKGEGGRGGSWGPGTPSGPGTVPEHRLFPSSPGVITPGSSARSRLEEFLTPGIGPSSGGL